MEKYVIISPSEINEYYKKGYEFVTVFYEEGPSNFQSANLNGSFMNNPFHLSGSIDGVNRQAKFLMVLNPTGEVLYKDSK